MSQKEPLPISEIPEKDMPDADDKFIIDTSEGTRITKMERIYERMESSYLGVITPSTTIPATGSWYGNILEAGTFNNVSPAITVDAADFDVENGMANNEVRIIISEGVASKDVRRVKGDTADPAKLPLYSAIKSANIAAGTQFIYNDTIYRAISDLAIGETPETNPEKVESLVANLKLSVQKISNSETENIFNKSFVKDGYAINSTGTESVNATRQILSKHPIPSGETITIGTWIESFNKNIVFFDESEVYISNQASTATSITLTTPLNAKFISVTMRTDTGTQTDIKDTMTIIAAKRIVTEIDNKPIRATELSFETLTPSDLEFDGESTNLADKSLVIENQMIDTEGDIYNISGWKMIAIDVSSYPALQSFTFGNFTIATNGYSAFYDGATKLKKNSLHTGTAKTVVKPAGATILYIDIARPSNSEIDWEELTVNVGNTLLPYESPLGKINRIDGHGISGTGGGTPIGTDPTFNSVTALLGVFGALDLGNVPEWDEVATTTLQAGDMYVKVDGSNYQLKVKG